MTVHDVITTGQRAPNDIVEAPDGSLWFTDPGPPGDTGHGRVCSYDPDTGAVRVLLDGIDFPNGLAFGPGGDVLHLAETATGRVVRYRWDGVALHRDGLSAVLPEGGPDGLAVDVEGRLYAAAPDVDAVFAFDPDGRPLEPLRFPGRAFPTNLCFAGPQRDELVVTAAKGGRNGGTRVTGTGRPARAWTAGACRRARRATGSTPADRAGRPRTRGGQTPTGSTRTADVRSAREGARPPRAEWGDAP
jgi:sugar lactone lactonase YvrE